MTNKEQLNKIVIHGVTEQGQRFRPSDWAERMSGRLATFRGQRVHYSPLLQPTMSEDGYKSILLDPALEQSNPELYHSILEFARKNNLKIRCPESVNI